MPKADPYDDSGRLHKDIKLDILRAKYWLGVGAQPTDTMWRLMSMVSVCQMSACLYILAREQDYRSRQDIRLTHAQITGWNPRPEAQESSAKSGTATARICQRKEQRDDRHDHGIDRPTICRRETDNV
jgi:ribosomal protein S16